MGRKKGVARMPRGAMKQVQRQAPQAPQMTEEEMLLAAQQQAMQMDPNLVYIWPPNAEQVDYSRFQMVWPAFINAALTIPRGRRVAKEHACHDPLVREMSEVCQSLQLTHVIEPYKSYPRVPMYPGRLRVRIVDENGEPCHPEIRNKKDLMRKMGELIPQLVSRHKRIADAQAQMRAAEEAKAAAASVTTTAAKKGKKAKKGKRR